MTMMAAPADAATSNDDPATANIVLIGAGWWSQGWHLPHLHRNEKVTIAAIVGAIYCASSLFY